MNPEQIEFKIEGDDVLCMEKGIDGHFYWFPAWWLKNEKMTMHLRDKNWWNRELERTIQQQLYEANRH